MELMTLWLVLEWVLHLLMVLAGLDMLRKIVFKIRQKAFAIVMASLSVKFDILTKEVRRKLYAPLAHMESADPELRKEKAIRILEIGCGSSTLLEYYPDHSRLVMLDPNPEFAEGLRKRLEMYPKLQLERLVHNYAEDMRDVPTGSVDAVISMYVLCSVTDVSKSLREIKRVLAPGGKYFFCEHVIDHQSGTILNFWQNLITKSGCYPFIACGCHLNRDNSKLLQKADFRTLQLEHFYMQLGKFWKNVCLQLAQSQICGVGSV